MSNTIVTPSTRGTSEPDGSALARDPERAAGIFAHESHIDQAAYLAGVDPMTYRLGLLDDERLAGVIEAAAKRFGWQFPWYPAGGPASWAKGGLRCGAGLAVGVEAGCRVATCAEVRSDGLGQLRVTRIVTAYEPGRGLGVVAVLDRPDLPSANEGEAPVIALAPAIANAIFAATGQRLHSLPPHTLAQLAAQ